ncbi:MAG: IS1096 element passenger TnpR family protein [Candidatus Methanofastidiosia archaeon]
MEKEKVYVFKAALKYQKGLWRRIEIKGNQTLGDFDHIMREAFNHDTGDHLSEFFSGRVWNSERFGEIEPGGSGSGAKKQIDQLGLTKGNTIEYVYDFGDDIQHVITLEKIVELEKKTAYPHIASKNKPRYRYCELCKKQGKNTIATWICIECSEEEQREVLLCEDCLEKEHEDHYADEILY